MKKRVLLNGTWQLSEAGGKVRNIPARVPGDVRATLSEEGLVPKDLFYRKNLEESRWVEESSWILRRTFEFDQPIRDRVQLVFNGLDLFASVSLNGHELGRTENMFRQYRFDVKDRIVQGTNEITVEFRPTKETIAELHSKYPDYRAIFYPGRSLVRKAQCQFGWDWAPDALSMGIWDDVYLENKDDESIRDVYVESETNGDCCFQIELASQLEGLLLRVTVRTKQGEIAAENTTRGVNNFVNIRIPNPALWWPRGLGEQNFYLYRVELLDESRRPLDRYEGMFGIRHVELREPVLDSDRTGFTLHVNGVPVFCKGANWTPAEAFPGTVTNGRYDYLVRRAAEANFNMLRVWGGGVYEKKGFYEACDRMGIMVWQDFMYACSEAPDDQQWFLENAIEEAEYQVKRLRKHPSVVVWCGGNESSSSHRYQPDRPGRTLANYYLRGVVGAMTKNTPYVISSPHSKNDFGQIPESGETHWSTWPRQKDDRFDDFRDRIGLKKTVFNSEVCLQGPSPMESMLRMVDEEDLWPPNEVVDYHVLRHPCNPHVHPRYVISQLKMAEQLIGDCSSASTFVANAMMAHAEMVQAELSYYRSEKFANSGALLWMYNEPWPCANWAVVDYFGYLKPAYYAARRAFAPLAAAVVRRSGGYEVCLMNDTLTDIEGTLNLRCMNLSGEVVWSKECNASSYRNSSRAVVFVPDKDAERGKGLFLRAVWNTTKGTLPANYFVDVWRDVSFEKPDFDFEIIQLNQSVGDNFHSSVRIRSANYSRFLWIHCPGIDIRSLSFEDNYFDLIPGESRDITIESECPLKSIEVRTLMTG